jgi:hypothetical protein
LTDCLPDGWRLTYQAHMPPPDRIRVAQA